MNKVAFYRHNKLMRKDWFSKLLLLCVFILFFGATVVIILASGNEFGAEFTRITDGLSSIFPF